MHEKYKDKRTLGTIPEPRGFGAERRSQRRDRHTEKTRTRRRIMKIDEWAAEIHRQKLMHALRTRRNANESGRATIPEPARHGHDAAHTMQSEIRSYNAESRRKNMLRAWRVKRGDRVYRFLALAVRRILKPGCPHVTRPFSSHQTLMDTTSTHNRVG